MNRIPKAKGKYFIPHQNNMKITQKESYNEHLAPKITQRNLKFSSNRNFGKEVSNSIKNNNQNKHNNSKIDDKNSNNNIYIKKHSSASQVSQKTQKTKISINDKQLLKENKSGLISKKNDISIINKDKDNYKIVNTKKEKIIQIGNSKLHSSISFGINNNNLNNNGTRPYSGNSISVRIPSQKNNKKLRNSSNNKININKVNNNDVDVLGNNNKNELTSSNVNIM